MRAKFVNEESNDCKKTKYVSKKYADLHIDIIRRKSNRNKIPQRSYFCNKCRSWHITSQCDTYADHYNNLHKNESLNMLKNRIKLVKESLNEFIFW